tara:strand:- start:40378 stop:41670 length:1293 start_codon:yes stop_codon:yes gene_type:complete
MTIVEEKQHSRLSPSSAKRWMTCPGSIGMAEKLGVKDKPSRFAAEGTVAHEIHELCLLNRQEAKEYIGKTIEADGMKFKVKQEMVDAVQLSLDYIWDKETMAIALDLRLEIRVEVKCSLTSLGVPGMDGGTSDVMLLLWDDETLLELEVFDYKHGAGVAVEVENNPQALSYALGTILLPELNGQGIPDGVLVTISQPRAHHPDGRIRTWKTDKDYLLNWSEEKLVPAGKAVHQASEWITSDTREEFQAFLVPSDDGCRFCKVAGQCPKLFAKTQEVAMVDFDSPDKVVMPEIDKLSAKQKQFIMDHAVMLRAFIVAVENQVKSEADNGSKEYDGVYKLVRKTTRRKFKEDALDELTSPLLDYLKHEDLFEEKTRSLTEIERRLKKLVGNSDAKVIMADVTNKPEGGLVIAPITDKRKSVEATINTDFTDL